MKNGLLLNSYERITRITNQITYEEIFQNGSINLEKIFMEICLRHLNNNPVNDWITISFMDSLLHFYFFWFGLFYFNQSNSSNAIKYLDNKTKITI